MIGSFILQGMKNAIKLIGKGARGLSKIAGKVSQTQLYKGAAKSARAFGTRMVKNVSNKRWWGRAVQVVRSSQSMLGIAGKAGAALKKTGGLLGFLGRGLSVFNTDYRSPKDFRKEMRAKEDMVKLLRAKRQDMIEKAKIAQEELKAPVSVEDLETSEEKLNVLAGQLNIMKTALAEIKGATFSSSTNIKGFEEYQIKANEQLADAINHGTEANMKTVLGGIEDAKDTNKAIVMSSTESIVGDITAKIDAIEDQRKEEEEFRRKNDWKRKFLKSVLFLADWILNWPFKLAMLALKIGALITGALGFLVLRHIEPIKKLIWAFRNGFAGVVSGIIYFKLQQFGWWLMEKIIGAIKWLLVKIIKIISGLESWFIGLFKNLPTWLGGGPDGVFANIAKGLDSASDAYATSVAAGLDSLMDGAAAVKDAAKDIASTLFAKVSSMYPGDGGDNLDAKAQEALKGDTPAEVSGKIKSGAGTETPADVVVEEPSLVDKIKSGGGLVNIAGDAIKDVAQKGIEVAAEVIETNNLDSRVTIIIDKAKDVSQSALNKTTAVIEKTRNDVMNNNEETFKELNKVSNQVNALTEGMKEVILGQGEARNANSGPSPSVEGATKTAFKESADQYNNLNQRS